MKISSELKVAFIGIATILVLIWGINYLKGRNILGRSYTLHAFYPESGGLENSAPVLLNGVKIGYVDKVSLRQGQPDPIEVCLRIEREYALSSASLAVLGSADLLGTRAIMIKDPGGRVWLEDQDTLASTLETDLMQRVEAQFFPVLEKVENLALALDSLSNSLNRLISGENIGEMLDHLNSLSARLDAAVAPGGSLGKTFSNLDSFTGTLKEKEDDLAAMIGNLSSLSEDLNQAGLDSLSMELHGVAASMNTLLLQVNSGSGSAGRFFYSDSLYLHLDLLMTNLDKLIRDLNENPEDYVQISVFGKSGRSKEK